MNISNIYNKCINRVKEILPKNMKKEKIESIENAIRESINETSKLNDIDENNNIKIDYEKYKKENIQLRIDNLNLHKENKKMHELILKINKDNEEMNNINKELSSIVEQFEKMDLKNTVGIYTEE